MLIRQLIVELTAVSSPETNARFALGSSSNAPVTFTSLATDTVTVSVVDEYGQEPCISSNNPIPAADILNGVVSDNVLRAIAADAQTENNTILWDGMDSNGQYLRPGVYSLVVNRTNADGLLDIEDSRQVVVEDSTNAPEISCQQVASYGNQVAVQWMTNVPTTGYVVVSTGGVPFGKFSTSVRISVNLISHFTFI